MYNFTDTNGESMGLEVCSHCKARQAHYEWEDEVTVVLKCVCGHLSVVYSETEKSTIVKVQPENNVDLPRQGSKLSKCLGVVALYYPKTIKTDVVANQLNDSTSSAASKLMVLQHKGLIEKTKSCRGIAGGSTWRLTNRGANHLNIKPCEGY